MVFWGIGRVSGIATLIICILVLMIRILGSHSEHDVSHFLVSGFGHSNLDDALPPRHLALLGDGQNEIPVLEIPAGNQVFSPPKQ